VRGSTAAATRGNEREGSSRYQRREDEWAATLHGVRFPSLDNKDNLISAT
jgi:hypothetical protein